MYPETYNAFAQKFRINLRLFFLLSFLFSVSVSEIIKRKTVIVLFFLSVSLFTFDFSLVYAQQPTQQWVQRFTQGNSASGLSVKLDSLGFVYVLVKSSIADSTNGDYCVLKYSNAGNFIWSAFYNSPGNLSDAPRAFAVSGSGDVYITGYTDDPNLISHITTIKFNSSGILQWTRVLYGGGGGAAASDINIDKAGNIVVIGGISVNDTLGYPLIIKYNIDGDSLWSRKFTQLFNHAYISNLAIDDQNSIYAVGDYAPYYPLSQYLTLKYDTDGNLLWYNTYNYTSYSNIADWISIDSNRNVYVVGTNQDSTTYQFYNTLLKLNSNGAIQWAKPYKGILNYPSCYLPGGLFSSSDGNSIFYTTFCYNGIGSGGDIVTLKYNAFGDTNWVRRYSSPMNSASPSALRSDKFNNIYIVGVGNYQSTGNDYVTIKYQPNGIQQWVATYNGPLSNSDDHARDLCIDTNFDVFITGTSSRQNQPVFLWDVATVKYNQPNGIQQLSSNIPRQFKLGSNYPNPFNPNTKFKFEIPKSGLVKIEVFDVLGREIVKLVDETLKAGTYEANWDAGNLSSGVYFYTLVAESFRETKKAILIK